MSLPNLPPDFTYHPVTSEEDKCIFRIKEVKDEESAMVWLAKFSDVTKSTWRKSKTYPRSGLFNVYQVDLKCVHNTDRRAKGLGPSKHTGCKAQIHIVVKRFISNSCSKKKDDLVKEFPAIITLKGKHNHALNTAATLKYRDISEEIVSKFRKLFRQGHNPSSALHCHKTDLLIEHEEHYYEVAADGKYVPSISVVRKLFDSEFAKEYGDCSEGEIFETLGKHLNDYEVRTGGIGKFKRTVDGKHYFIVLCTPIMLRAHKTLPQSSELVMLDASGGMDKDRHRIYSFVTPCAAGGIPLGIIITDSESEAVFEEAIELFKGSLPDYAFFSSKFPKVFMTDNDLKEISALGKSFPNSTLLLCHFHMLRAVWKWLFDGKHGISARNRQELYCLFRNLLYSKNEDAAKKNLDLLIQCALKYNYSKFLIYVSKLHKQKKMWMSFYRSHLPLRGNNTTNYVEIVFRLLKDCILDRLMAFNIIQLVDYLVSQYEMYTKKRLIDFCNGKYAKILLKKMIPISVTENYHISESAEFGVFSVTDENQKTYHVNLEQGFCTCPSGKSGQLCKHSSCVILKLDHKINTSYNVLCTKSKEDIFFVAEGVAAPKNWFLPLHKEVQQPTESEPESNSRNDDKLMFSINTANEHENAADITEDPQNIVDDPDHHNSEDDEYSNSRKLAKEVLQKFEETVLRIKEGLSKDPENFVPAVHKFVTNVDKFAKTDSGLISALHTFGRHNGLQPSNIKKRRCHRTNIGVQPTAIGRRKCCLTGKRKISAGRPSGIRNVKIKDHNYTTFGYLPSRKRKAPHDIQKCVEDNKMVGGNKKAKM